MERELKAAVLEHTILESIATIAAKCFIWAEVREGSRGGVLERANESRLRRVGVDATLPNLGVMEVLQESSEMLELLEESGRREKLETERWSVHSSCITSKHSRWGG